MCCRKVPEEKKDIPVAPPVETVLHMSENKEDKKEEPKAEKKRKNKQIFFLY